MVESAENAKAAVMRVPLLGMPFSDSPDLGHVLWTLCHPDSARGARQVLRTASAPFA